MATSGTMGHCHRWGTSTAKLCAGEALPQKWGTFTGETRTGETVVLVRNFHRWGSCAGEELPQVRQLCRWGTSTGEAVVQVRAFHRWDSCAVEGLPQVRQLCRWGTSTGESCAVEGAAQVRQLCRWGTSTGKELLSWDTCAGEALPQKQGTSTGKPLVWVGGCHRWEISADWQFRGETFLLVRHCHKWRTLTDKAPPQVRHFHGGGISTGEEALPVSQVWYREMLLLWVTSTVSHFHRWGIGRCFPGELFPQVKHHYASPPSAQ